MSKRIDPLNVSLAVEHGELNITIDDGYIYLEDVMNGEKFIIGEYIKDRPMEVIEVHVDEYACTACGYDNNTSDGYIVGDNYCPNCGQKIKIKEVEE